MLFSEFVQALLILDKNMKVDLTAFSEPNELLEYIHHTLDKQGLAYDTDGVIITLYP